jgi:uncharacterized membrane protein YedE/YeeE
MSHFTPIASTLGGVLIGIAAALLLAFNGRMAGVSGIVAGALLPREGEFLWRLLFVLGMVAGGAAAGWLRPGAIEATTRAPLVVALAGLLVGFGSRLGGGCTSGHGICGISRLSRRSIAATLTFLVSGAATVFVSLHAAGALQ